MHLEMASMYARALQVGCSMDDLIDMSTPFIQPEEGVRIDEAA